MATMNPALARLRSMLRGNLVLPDDDGYDDARAVWNAAIDRRPAAIARCADARDVQHALEVARAQNLLVAVRGGGHSFAGKAVCDGGLVIDGWPDEAGGHRSRAAHCARGHRLHSRRLRRRDAGRWACHHAGHRAADGDLGSHARRRDRLADGQLRPRLRQRRRRRGRHGRRPRRARERRGESGPPLGLARGRWKFRRRDGARVPTAPGDDGAGRRHHVSRRSRARTCCALTATSPTARPTRSCDERHAAARDRSGLRRSRVLERRSGGGREGDRAVAASRASRCRTRSGAFRTSRSSRCFRLRRSACRPMREATSSRS